MTQRAFLQSTATATLTSTPQSFAGFLSSLLCCAFAFLVHVVRLGACGLGRAAPNVVIAVRLMAINVINLYNKKQYQNDSKNDNNNIGAMQINSTKWEINKTNKKKKSADCVRLFSLLLLFAFGILIFVGFRGFFIALVAVVAFWEFFLVR